MFKWLKNLSDGIKPEPVDIDKLKEAIDNEYTWEDKPYSWRNTMGSIDIDLTYIDDMTQNERKDFLQAVHLLNQSKPLKRILNELIKNQILFVAQQATDMDQMSFGRGCANGLALFKEEIEKLSSIYEDENKKEEEFDKHKAI